jgi:flagellar biosynthesis protein FlhG
MDEATALQKIRRGSRKSPATPVRVVCVASGKGGVGKTNTTVNLALAQAQVGRKAMLLDADMSLANVDVLLGLKVERDLSDVLDGHCTLDEVALCGPSGLRIIPGSSGIQRLADLGGDEQAGLIAAFSYISDPPDHLYVDSASGISRNVLTFARAANDVVVVVCDEPASLTDAYALIKVLNQEHSVDRFQIICNRATGATAGQRAFEKLIRVSEQFLDVSLHFLGQVPEDSCLRKSVQKRAAVLQAFPSSKAARAYRAIAERIEQLPLPCTPSGYPQLFVERLLGQELPTEPASA